MTRRERAKQFMAFDAMKGLSEALLEREEMHSRTEKHEVSEEQAALNSDVLGSVSRGMEVRMECHMAFHDVCLSGKVDRIDRQARQISVGGRTVPFSDIYSITVTGMDG